MDVDCNTLNEVEAGLNERLEKSQTAFDKKYYERRLYTVDKAKRDRECR